jgi:hypothetical protein
VQSDDDNLWDVERYGVLLYRAKIRDAGSGDPRRRADQLRKAMRDPRGIRAWLNVRRKIAGADGDQIIWRALFALYGIPDEWSWADKCEWLAARLAHELFPRCQALWKPHGGGPSQKRQADMAERKRKLREEWEAYLPGMKSELQRAKLFMKDEKHKEACAAAGLTSPKAFVQAMKQISSGTPR